MTTTKHFMPNFNDTQNGINIKNEIGSKQPPQQQQHNDKNISCVYNSQSPSSKTILITNNYSQVSNKPNTNASNLNNSSITIYTHNNNSDTEGSTIKAPSSPRATVVLDRINILINNHFNEPTVEKTMPTESANIHQHHHAHNDQINKINPTTLVKKDENQIIAANASIEFSLGQDVLVKQNDDRYWLGTIISLTSTMCLVKFDDYTELWSKFDKLSQLNCTNELPVCVVCKEIDELEKVDVCQSCRRGYHKKCRNGTEINSIWYCKRCTAQNGGFSYELNSLTWDKYHRVNSEQIYCYCGKNGNWYMKMIQCVRCRQWFHELCVKCLEYPLFYGDRFYIFVCSVCNHGKEYVQRLHIKLDDIIQLIFFNLAILHSREFFTLDDIFPYALNNWKALNLPSNLRKLTHSDVKNQILKTLSTRKITFKCREIKKIIEYGLRCQQAPFVPNIVFQQGPSVTEKYVKSFCYENYRLHVIPKSVQTSGGETIERKTKNNSYEKNGSDDSESILSEPSTDNDSESEIALSHLSNSYRKVVTKKNCESFIHPPSSSPRSVSRPTSPNLINGSSSNDFYVDSDRSRDVFDFDEKNFFKRKLNRRRKTMSGYKTPTELIDLCESSDDTSSRSTLNLIIPPPKNFHGFNNPFLSPPKLKKDQENARGNNSVGSNNGNATTTATSSYQPLSLFGKTNLLPNSKNFRVVRTVKRRLSAKDIMIGPNQEVKRRKTRRRSSGNVEVISTATIHTLSKYPTYLPIRNDAKDMPISSIRLLNSTSSSTSTTPIASTSVSPLENVVTPTKNGRRLRKRHIKNYAENIRRKSMGTANGPTPNGTVSLTNTSSANNSNASEVSLLELQSSLTAFFGAATRIESGEPFVVRGKRIGTDGRYQYLIEWDGVS